MLRDTVRSRAVSSHPTRGHEPPRLTEAVPQAAPPAPRLVTMTGAFLAGAGAPALTQQRMAGLAKRVGLGWAGANLSYKELPWGFAQQVLQAVLIARGSASAPACPSAA